MLFYTLQTIGFSKELECRSLSVGSWCLLVSVVESSPIQIKLSKLNLAGEMPE